MEDILNRDFCSICKYEPRNYAKFRGCKVKFLDSYECTHCIRQFKDYYEPMDEEGEDNNDN